MTSSHGLLVEKNQGTLNSSDNYGPTRSWQNVLSATPEDEDRVVEALEELRINHNLRQWRVCSLICESLADKFRDMAKKSETKGKR
jgi:hypothetical protein